MHHYLIHPTLPAPIPFKTYNAAKRRAKNLVLSRFKIEVRP